MNFHLRTNQERRDSAGNRAGETDGLVSIQTIHESSSGIEIKAPVVGQMADILTPEALAFVGKLVREFQPTAQNSSCAASSGRMKLITVYCRIFLEATKSIRDDKSWRVASIPADLQDRRTEITGPVDRKMVINALNSGAKVFMADFEDATSPTWKNLIEGQFNLRDAVRRTISFSNPDGKKYSLNEKNATLLVRPRAGICRKSMFSWTPADFRQPIRLRFVFLSQRHRVAEARQRAIFLSAEDGEPSRSAASGTTFSIARRTR